MLPYIYLSSNGNIMRFPRGSTLRFLPLDAPFTICQLVRRIEREMGTYSPISYRVHSTDVVSPILSAGLEKKVEGLQGGFSSQ